MYVISISNMGKKFQSFFFFSDITDKFPVKENKTFHRKKIDIAYIICG